MRSFIRVNHKIRVQQIRCAKADGTMLGLMSTRDAMKLAQEDGLDLVEISPNANPPVCRIMDYGKFRYDESIKQKGARKQSHLKNKALKEIKFHANVAQHDYETKINHIKAFLKKGHKVKISLQFRGRENAHRELGFEVIKRAIVDCQEISVVDNEPRLMGRNIVAMVGPKSKK